MEVSRAETPETLLEAGQSHWLVLEETGSTLSALYELSSTPEYEWLFLETAYAGFLRRSPLVIRVESLRDELFQAFREDPIGCRFPGIMVSSRASEADVLSHLRRCLAVRFYGGRLGMVRFFHPAITAALFSPEAKPGAEWMGPCERWIWFGGTLAQQVEVGSCWYALGNVEGESPATEGLVEVPPLRLSSGQERALETYIRQQRAWREYRQPEDRLEDNPRRQHFLEVFRLAETLAMTEAQRLEYFVLSRMLPSSDVQRLLDKVSAEHPLEALRRHVKQHGERSAR